MEIKHDANVKKTSYHELTRLKRDKYDMTLTFIIATKIFLHYFGPFRAEIYPRAGQLLVPGAFGMVDHYWVKLSVKAPVDWVQAWNPLSEGTYHTNKI